MQVSQIAELDSHAVIGGGEAEAFGISEDAEFFTVLSDTMYRDKKRAVARETICNAWDAHIMVGKTDTHIDIKITDDELIIKDYGPGIAHARIRPIYCIYGKSTKVKDGSQTGGFGLGSKAPFAYADHFSVTSCFEGTRTVYAASRGGRETEGKPDMRPMVQVPTTESGLTVTIPIANRADMLDFITHIKSVVLQGGIKAKLNGTELPTFEYGVARQTGFALMPHGVYELSEAKVYVLYGTVLYPVTTTDKAILAATNALAGLLGNNDNARFVIIAKPHSIGVTPSRESLSYSEKTTATIHGLLERAEKFIRRNGAAAASRVALQRISRVQSLKDWSNNVDLTVSTGESLITDPIKIAEYSLSTRFYSVLGREEARYLEVRALGKKFKDERRFYRRLAGRMRTNPLTRIHKARWRWDVRIVLRMAAKLGVLDNLFITGDKHLVPLRNSTVSDWPKIVRGGLIISRTRTDAVAEAKDRSGRSFALVLPKADEVFLAKVAELCAAFNLNHKILDFTRPEKKKPVKKPKEVWSFDEIVHAQKEGIYYLPGAPTVDKAPYYVRLFGTPGDIRMPREWAYAFHLVKDMFPGAAVCFDLKQEERLKKAGAKPLVQHVADELEKLGQSKDVQYAFAASAKLFVTDARDYTVSGLISKLCASDLKFAKHFFPAKVRIGPKTDRAKALAHFVTIATMGTEERHTSELRDQFSTIRFRIEREAAKTFEELLTSPHKINAKYPYLAPLRGADPHDYSVEHWFDLFSALQRPYERNEARRAARAMKLTAKTAEMKEAA